MFFSKILKIPFIDRVRVTIGRRSSTPPSANMSTSHPTSAVLIFLHGLGDVGASWKSQLQSMVPSHIKCVCPTAPVSSVTLNMGLRMTSWFDLISLSATDPEDAEGIKNACKQIHSLIEEQVKAGTPHERIMLGGFSQGGALALYSALRYPKKLAGVLALSCWLPLNNDFPAAAQKENTTIPYLQCHGTDDFIVPLAWGEASKLKIKTFLGDNYTFKTYEGLGHSSNAKEMNDAKSFITSCLKAK